MNRAIGSIVFGLSACGYPLTQLVIRRWGMRGAAAAECVCAGLAIRDASMVASGAPGRLRRLPAALLRLELAVGVAASLAGLHPLLSARSADRRLSRTGRADESEVVGVGKVEDGLVPERGEPVHIEAYGAHQEPVPVVSAASVGLVMVSCSSLNRAWTRLSSTPCCAQ